MNQNTPLTLLDGRRLYYSFLAGAQRIFESQNLLNKINVFPVADADTGTNLASTMRSIVESPIPTNNIKATADALAEAALIGARGNSGIIFAQFLFGFSNEIGNEIKLDISTFAYGIKNAVHYAYEAIASPVEGTILSVMREWADYVYLIKDQVDDFLRLMVEAFEKALEALDQTALQMMKLRSSNTVDAGAQAFVLFLEGMIEHMRSGNIRDLMAHRDVPQAMEINIEHPDHPDDLTFRYCTEALINLKKDHAGKDALKKSIETLGDSLVIAGSNTKMRIHIHSNQPDVVFEQLKDYGAITYQKIDDMVMQADINQKKALSTAVVTDSTCDLPDEIIEKYQIQMMPLSVQINESTFLDRFSIRAEKFYQLIEQKNIKTSTAQPSFRDFYNRYNYLSTHYDDILGIHISSKMSGTYQNSLNAARQIAESTKKNITVTDSGRLASGLGIVVLRAAKALEQGESMATVAAEVPQYRDKTRMLVSSKTIKYMVRSGRVPAMKATIGRLLNLKPIITVNSEGKAENMGAPFTEKASRNLVLREAKKIIQNNEIWGYSISHANNDKTAHIFHETMKELTGLDPEFVTAASPVLTAQVGPGVVALSIMIK